MEKKMTHTPGPWGVYAGKMKNGDRIICDEENGPVAYAVDYNAYAKDAEVDANAALIASSPDLFAACREALTIVDHAVKFAEDNGGEEAYTFLRMYKGTASVLRAAIARAEGK